MGQPALPELPPGSDESPAPGSEIRHTGSEHCYYFYTEQTTT